MPDLQPVLIDPSGGVWPLDVDLPIDGRWAPPVTHREEETYDGTQVVGVRHGPREVAFPLTIDGGGDPQTFQETMRAFVDAVDPTVGTSRLRWPAPDGSVRELECLYARGLEATETVDNGATTFTWTRQVVVFRAADPFWRDVEATSITVRRGAGLPEFFPFPPLELTAGDVFASPTVDNDGSVEAWPVWTVHGATSAVTIANLTTGRILEVVTPLADGETLTIDSRPGVKTVRGGDGANRFGALSAASSLWSLVRGENRLSVDLTDASDDAYVTAEWVRRWRTA